jgi:hypothetical protein
MFTLERSNTKITLADCRPNDIVVLNEKDINNSEWYIIVGQKRDDSVSLTFSDRSGRMYPLSTPVFLVGRLRWSNDND